MKYFFTIVLFAISGVAIASGNHSGGHGHEQSKTDTHGHGGNHHGNGHGETHHNGNHGHNSGHGHGSGGHMQSTVGMPAKAEQATKTIAVELLDTMRFKFSEEVKIKDGDIVKFVVTNTGRLPHEFSIGDQQEQDAHRQMMRNMPNMHHEDGNAVSLKPGETKILTWHFKGSGDVVFACNIPGHYEAGMHHKSALGKK